MFSGEDKVAPSESRFWQSLRRHNATTRTNGLSGRQRRYYQYDRRHGGEVEVYDRNGRHLGAADPHTGEMIKGPVKGRRIRP
ncbi:MAG: hypothetical protein HZY74_08965 [Brevundimonas sp.]|nr:MAG: hypothetical protein HZY74_08965 [Brevundimonas sp.]